MFLSVIIPVFNAEKYISECLDSLIEQDIPSKDYEIICIDDGSIDESFDVMQKYAANYPNIKAAHQENAGVSVARNTGMDASIGDYYWFVDSDDFVRENSLAKLKSICEQKKCDILSFRLFYFDDSESEMLKKRLNAGETISSNSIIRAQPSMFISRELIGSQRWHPGVEVGEDSLFLRELMMKNPYVFEIDDTVYFYRQHSSSSIHSGGSSTRRMFSHVNGALIAKELYDSPGGHCEANANLLRMFVIYAMVAIARNKSDQRTQALSLMRKADLFPFKMPKEATSKNNFHTNRTDLFGKVYGFLCTNSGSRIGQLLLKGYYRIRE